MKTWTLFSVLTMTFSTMAGASCRDSMQPYGLNPRILCVLRHQWGSPHLHTNIPSCKQHLHCRLFATLYFQKSESVIVYIHDKFMFTYTHICVCMHHKSIAAKMCAIYLFSLPLLLHCLLKYPDNDANFENCFQLSTCPKWYPLLLLLPFFSVYWENLNPATPVCLLWFDPIAPTIVLVTHSWFHCFVQGSSSLFLSLQKALCIWVWGSSPPFSSSHSKLWHPVAC